MFRNTNRMKRNETRGKKWIYHDEKLFESINKLKFKTSERGRGVDKDKGPYSSLCISSLAPPFSHECMGWMDYHIRWV